MKARPPLAQLARGTQYSCWVVDTSWSGCEPAPSNRLLPTGQCTGLAQAKHKVWVAVWGRVTPCPFALSRPLILRALTPEPWSGWLTPRHTQERRQTRRPSKEWLAPCPVDGHSLRPSRHQPSKPAQTQPDGLAEASPQPLEGRGSGLARSGLACSLGSPRCR